MSDLFETLCHQGFCYVDPVASDELQSRAVAAAKRMFTLPGPTRTSFYQPEWGGLVGYQYSDSNEIGCENLDSEYWHLVQPREGGFETRWPLDDVRGTFEQLMKVRERYALEILAEIEHGLDSGETLSGWVRDEYTMLRVIRYPERPPLEDEKPGDEIRARAHIDTGLLSLYDAGDQPDLEVMEPSTEERIAVEPGSCVVAASELLSRCSTGRIPAVLHRVVGKWPSPERIAMPLFLNPRFDQDVGGEFYGAYLRARTG